MILAAINPMHAFAADDEPAVKTGWQTESSRLCYLDENGTRLVGEQEIDGVWYLFAPNGNLQTGWQTVQETRRYFKPDTGESVVGWFEWRDALYYIDKESGKLTNRIMENETGTYYLDSCGCVTKSGFADVSDTVRVYANEDGLLVTGLQTIDEKEYLFDETAALQHGWQTLEQGTFYFDIETGQAKYGFLTLDDSTYYVTKENGKSNGLTQIDGKTYYFDAEGIMQLGFVSTAENEMRHFDSDGTMSIGFKEVDGNTYYFDSNGIMCSGIVTISDQSYLFGSDGKLLIGSQTLNGNSYFSDEQGVLQSGWKELNGNFYYFQPESYTMVKSATVEGYIIDADGVAKTQLAVTVNNLLKSSGTTPYSIYKYMTANYRYRKIEATRTREELNAQGWDKLVSYLLTNKRGVCYYLAATMDYFMQQAGLTTRIVHATHSTGDHYWNQVYVNGAWLNYDPTYTDRGNISWENQIKKGSYKVYGFIKVNYDARGTYLGTDFTPY